MNLNEFADNLNDNHVVHTARLFPSELFQLARRKGVFPYKVKSLKDYRLKELPRIEDFYSCLNDDTRSKSEMPSTVKIFFLSQISSVHYVVLDLEKNPFATQFKS